MAKEKDALHNDIYSLRRRDPEAEDLLRRAKALAALQGKTLREFIKEALAEKIDREWR